MSSFCSKCNSLAHVVKINPGIGDSFFLSTFDSKTKIVHADKGIIVDVYACTNCGDVQMVIKQLDK
jgi:hypothetical protein